MALTPRCAPPIAPAIAASVAEEYADRREAHGRPVAQRAAGEGRRRDGAPVAAGRHRFEDLSRSPAVAAPRVVVLREGPAQWFLDDGAMRDQRFGHADHHLR